MKKLGFGLMRLPLLDPNESTSIDLEQTKQMVDAFLAKGFTYFDTAWMYCGFASENATKEVLVDRHPRDSYTLATKLHMDFVKEKEDVERIFNEQKAKTGVEYFDYYLLHDLNLERYLKNEALGTFEWLQEKKRQGLVKHIGFSFHDKADVLDRILSEHPEMEFVQLQLNYLDWESETVQSRKCHEVAVKHNMPIIVMEPVKGGTLAQVPDNVAELFSSYDPTQSVASWALRYAAGLEGVFMVLSGMSNTAQMEDNLQIMDDPAPLNDEEHQMILKAVEMLRTNIAVPCTGCSYCVEGCPSNIAIAKYFSLYNVDKKIVREADWKPQKENYEALTQSFGKADDCIGCGQCEELCPQHLPIMEHLKTIAAHFQK